MGHPPSVEEVSLYFLGDDIGLVPIDPWSSYVYYLMMSVTFPHERPASQSESLAQVPAHRAQGEVTEHKLG